VPSDDASSAWLPHERNENEIGNAEACAGNANWGNEKDAGVISGGIDLGNDDICSASREIGSQSSISSITIFPILLV
jgi:hypothetical protein